MTSDASPHLAELRGVSPYYGGVKALDSEVPKTEAVQAHALGRERIREGRTP